MQIRFRIADMAGFGRRMQSTFACGEISGKSNAKISIYINTDNMQGHIRSMGIDIQPLSPALGSGGHKHAAGFSIKGNYDFKKKGSRKRYAALLNYKAGGITAL